MFNEHSSSQLVVSYRISYRAITFPNPKSAICRENHILRLDEQKIEKETGKKLITFFILINSLNQKVLLQN